MVAKPRPPGHYTDYPIRENGKRKACLFKPLIVLTDFSLISLKEFNRGIS